MPAANPGCQALKRIAAGGLGPLIIGLFVRQPIAVRYLQIFLPIADLPVNVFLILGIGFAVGIVSGMFGIGGGFLLTPALIFMGIPSGVVVASVASHIAASSFSSALRYWRRRSIDLQLACVLLTGGLVGSAIGVWLFTQLQRIGQLDVMVSVSYVILLTTIGVAMVNESVRALRRSGRDLPGLLRRGGGHTWLHSLPLRMRFRRSKIYVSIIPICLIGALTGLLGAVMGIGGGFLLVPMLIYMLRIPTTTVVGTSTVLTLITMAAATVMHSVSNHLVDVVLGVLLMAGGAMGAQLGANAGQRLRPERLRLILGILLLAVGLRFSTNLLLSPAESLSFRAAASTQ